MQRTSSTPFATLGWAIWCLHQVPTQNHVDECCKLQGRELVLQLIDLGQEHLFADWPAPGRIYWNAYMSGSCLMSC